MPRYSPFGIWCSLVEPCRIFSYIKVRFVVRLFYGRAREGDKYEIITQQHLPNDMV